jgi:putative serine protease PepD
MATSPITTTERGVLPPEAPRRLTGRGLVAAAAGIALVAGLVGGLIARWLDAGTPPGQCPAQMVADTVLPSVVTIKVTAASGIGNGSGEVIRGNGYILTNDHVISAGAAGGTIDALFTGGQTKRATIVGRAARLDLAVLKVEPPRGLPTIEIGRSEPLRVGQPVVALGAPLGLSGTVTSGIISALGRDVPVPADDGTAILAGAVQTDAAINPGNSGGALVDCAGRLVGINTAIATVPNASGEPGGGSVGIGFAIPVDLAMRVADELISHGTFNPPYVGATVTPIPSSIAERFGVRNGLFVQTITPAGPADAAGLRVGDVITAVDNKEANGPDDLFLVTLTKKAGERVAIDYVRDGRAGRTQLTLAARP